MIDNIIGSLRKGTQLVVVMIVLLPLTRVHVCTYVHRYIYARILMFAHFVTAINAMGS